MASQVPECCTKRPQMPKRRRRKGVRRAARPACCQNHKQLKGDDILAENTARPRGTDGAQIVLNIRTEALCGSGTEEDPVRKIVQYWTLDGTLIATLDPYLRSI